MGVENSLPSPRSFPEDRNSPTQNIALVDFSSFKTLSCDYHTMKFSGFWCLRGVAQPSPLSGSRAVSSPQKEARKLRPHQLSLAFPSPSPGTHTSPSCLCMGLSWTFYRNGVRESHPVCALCLASFALSLFFFFKQLLMDVAFPERGTKLWAHLGLRVCRGVEVHIAGVVRV